MGTRAKWITVGLAAGLASLLIPEPYPEVPEGPGYEPFAWASDALWEQREARYRAQAACPKEQATVALDETVAALTRERPGPDDPRWARLENDFFAIAVDYARCPARVTELLELRRRVRVAAKDASLAWKPSVSARRRLYRLLHGSRAAVEEVLLQLPPGVVPPISRGRSVPSSTPSTVIQGVRVHSGDLLLSRGGAPTSAFIARGSDYPGNFSHVALAHVDEQTGQAIVIESHIERGVIIATPAQYFADKKLRIQLMRLRADHPALRADPQLPHRAATAAKTRTEARHIPYDFAMDFTDPSEQFCSEVASSAYARHGVTLWSDLTAFSSPGLARWMAGFGVRQRETHGPSDLEYDRSLQVVAEWHDRDTLLDDHLDNAVIDIMLERAEAGLELDHDARLLPLARLLKAYSAVLNLFGAEGPIPEGMSATVALRARWLERTHVALALGVREQAAVFRREHGYQPPYWELLDMARKRP